MHSLQSAEAAVKAGVQSGGGAALPGMIFNQSKKVTYTDAVTGQDHSVYAGRMECTMQVCLIIEAAGAASNCAYAFLMKTPPRGLSRHALCDWHTFDASAPSNYTAASIIFSSRQ